MAQRGVRTLTHYHSTVVRYRLVAWAAARISPSVTRRVSKTLGALAPIIDRQRAAVIREHLTKVTGVETNDGQIRRAFTSYIRYWIDAFRAPSLSPDQRRNALTAQGFDHLEEALRNGRGVIIALPHLGNWDVAGAWLTAHDIALTVVAEELEPPEMFEWFAGFRQKLGVSVVANSSGAATKLAKALKRNEAIALLCDRDVDGTGGQFDFFGEKTRIPKGPATLALRTGAALLPVAAYEDGDRYRAVIGPPIDTARTGRLSDDVHRVTNDLLAQFEQMIKVAPEQWHVFQPNWPSVLPTSDFRPSGRRPSGRRPSGEGS